MEDKNKYVEGVDMDKIYFINNFTTKNKSAIYRCKDGKYISYIHLDKPTKRDKTKTTYTHIVCPDLKTAKIVACTICEHGGQGK